MAGRCASVAPTVRSHERRACEAGLFRGEALAALKDVEINTSDIPEQLHWTGARGGVFFRPIGG